MRQSHYATVHPIREFEFEADESPALDEPPRALRYFHARTFSEAASQARALLSAAETCPRCSRAITQLYERLGSTLFCDDDPQALVEAYEPQDQNPCTLQILAALIVLEGRDRIVPSLPI